MVYQEVTRNRKLSAAAKGLYAYLSSFCGLDDECYPSVETITKEMSMGKDTFYRHINALIAAGVVEKQQVISEDGKFGRVLYRLSHKVEIHDFPNGGKHDFPFPQNEDTQKPDTAVRETNNNNTNNNNTNNNNNKERGKRFTPPTLSEVQSYCEEKGYLIDAEQFISFYDSKGWMIGKNKMRDWKAAVRTWVQREKKGNRQPVSNAKPTGFTNFEQRNYNFDELERKLLDAQKGAKT